MVEDDVQVVEDDVHVVEVDVHVVEGNVPVVEEDVQVDQDYVHADLPTAIQGQAENMGSPSTPLVINDSDGDSGKQQ